MSKIQIYRKCIVKFNYAGINFNWRLDVTSSIKPLLKLKSMNNSNHSLDNITSITIDSINYKNHQYSRRYPLALTKQTIIEKISTKNNQTPSQAKDSLETLLEIMKSTLASGEDIMISRFGKFQVNEKAPRKGRNPATGKDMMLKERRTVTFRCSGGLRDRINNEF
jgi:integration host factor subunit alpha